MEGIVILNDRVSDFCPLNGYEEARTLNDSGMVNASPEQVGGPGDERNVVKTSQEENSKEDGHCTWYIPNVTINVH